MLGDILRCLRQYFLKPKETTIIHDILTNLTKIPRFGIIKMFLTKEDFNNFEILINFLNKHENPLNNEIKQLYNYFILVFFLQLTLHHNQFLPNPIYTNTFHSSNRKFLVQNWHYNS